MVSVFFIVVMIVLLMDEENFVTPPNATSYKLFELGNRLVGWAIFKSDKKLFRSDVTYYNGVWIIKHVPFFDKDAGVVKIYECYIDPLEKTRYAVFYPWWGDFIDEKFTLVDEVNVGLNIGEKVVSFYSQREKYAGVIVGKFILLNNNGRIYVYDGLNRLITITNLKNVKNIVESPTLQRFVM